MSASYKLYYDSEQEPWHYRHFRQFALYRWAVGGIWKQIHSYVYPGPTDPIEEWIRVM